MPKDSQIERTFKVFFDMTNLALAAARDSLKDASIPEPPKPKSVKQAKLPPALRTPFDANV